MMSKKAIELQLQELKKKLVQADIPEMKNILKQIEVILSHEHDGDIGETLLILSEEMRAIGEKKVANDYVNLKKELADKEKELEKLANESCEYRRIAGEAFIKLQELEKDYETRKKELEITRYSAQTKENYANQEIEKKQREIAEFKRKHNLE